MGTMGIMGMMWHLRRREKSNFSRQQKATVQQTHKKQKFFKKSTAQTAKKQFYPSRSRRLHIIPTVSCIAFWRSMDLSHNSYFFKVFMTSFFTCQFSLKLPIYILQIKKKKYNLRELIMDN
jgi:hypothetical protein